MTRAAARARGRGAVRIGAITVAVALLGVGCGDPVGHSASPDPPRAPLAAAAPTTAPSTAPPTTPVTTAPSGGAAAVSVKIGFLGGATTSGALSVLTRTVENGERLAVSQFASDHPGVAATIDVPPAGETTAVAARRLVSDGVTAVIGPQSSTEVAAALPILTAAGIPAVTATATAPDLAGSGWTSFFRMVADDRQQGIAAASELVGSLHLSNLAVLVGGAGAALVRGTWVSSAATRLGAVATPPTSAATPASVADGARLAVSSGVDGVYFSGPAALAQALVGDLGDDGYQGAVLIAAEDPSTVLGPLGASADGVYVASPADDPAAAAHSGPGLVFEDAYRAAFGTEAPVWAAEAYDATNFVLQAVASGATTGPAVAAYLFNHSSSGVCGPVSFESSGNAADPPLFVSQMRNEAPVQVATVVSSP